jgi:hypothetical protein
MFLARRSPEIGAGPVNSVLAHQFTMPKVHFLHDQMNFDLA